MGGIMKRTLVTLSAGAFAAMLTLFAYAAPASAVQPAEHACVGTTHSSNNAAYDGPTGQITSAFAQDPNSRPGLGDGIHELQLGNVPDSVVPNTCND
jgi:uncharacterized membrane protein